MSRRLYTLVLAQFLSAFGDNAILFTVIAMTLAGVSEIWMAKAVLLIIGIRSGLFVAPLNAALQDIGRRGVVAAARWAYKISSRIALFCYAWVLLPSPPPGVWARHPPYSSWVAWCP